METKKNRQDENEEISRPLLAEDANQKSNQDLERNKREQQGGQQEPTREQVDPTKKVNE